MIGCKLLTHENPDDEGHASLPTPTKPTTTDLLLHHMQVNRIADYYNIPPLLALANTRIEKILRKKWSADRFSDVVKEAFTSNNDIELQELISSAVNKNIEELIEREDFTAPDIIRHFSLSIIRYMIKERKLARECHSDALMHARKRASWIAKLGFIENCQNDLCTAEFNGQIKLSYVGGGDPVYQLQCRECGKRHFRLNAI